VPSDANRHLAIQPPQQALINQVSTPEANYRASGVLLDPGCRNRQPGSALSGLAAQTKKKESKTVQNKALAAVEAADASTGNRAGRVADRYQAGDSRIREIDAKLKAGHDILTPKRKQRQEHQPPM